MNAKQRRTARRAEQRTIKPYVVVAAIRAIIRRLRRAITHIISDTEQWCELYTSYRQSQACISKADQNRFNRSGRQLRLPKHNEAASALYSGR